MRYETSVIIPTHNRPKLVLRAIESVASQTRTPSELIVVNDGSQIDYGAVEEALEDMAIESVYLETPGFGASTARNLGASKASGDVLMFLDDDDRWRSQKVARQLDRFTDNIGLVYSGRFAVTEQGKALYPIKGGREGNISEEILVSNVIGTTSSPAIHADLFDAVDGFDEEMPGLQDWELWIRLCQETTVAYDSEYTVEWTVHESEGDQMTSQSDRYTKAIQLLREKHRDKFQALSWTDRRRARAQQHKSLAAKYSNSRLRMQYLYAMRSLSIWPSVGAVAQLIPEPALTTLRAAQSRLSI